MATLTLLPGKIRYPNRARYMPHIVLGDPLQRQAVVDSTRTCTERYLGVWVTDAGRTNSRCSRQRQPQANVLARRTIRRSRARRHVHFARRPEHYWIRAHSTVNRDLGRASRRPATPFRLDDPI